MDAGHGGPPVSESPAAKKQKQARGPKGNTEAAPARAQTSKDRAKQDAGPGTEGPASSLAPDPGDIRSILGKTVGAFRFTAKQHYYPSGGSFGGWEASCPHHRKNESSGCRKWIPVRGPNLSDRATAAAVALDWCAKADVFSRQREHLSYLADWNAVPEAPITRKLPIFSREKPTGIRTDAELDAPEPAPAAPTAKAKANAKVKAKAKAKSQAKTKAEGKTKAKAGQAKTRLRCNRNSSSSSPSDSSDSSSDSSDDSDSSSHSSSDS